MLFVRFAEKLRQAKRADRIDENNWTINAFYSILSKIFPNYQNHELKYQQSSRCLVRKQAPFNFACLPLIDHERLYHSSIPYFPQNLTFFSKFSIILFLTYSTNSKKLIQPLKFETNFELIFLDHSKSSKERTKGAYKQQGNSSFLIFL